MSEKKEQQNVPRLPNNEGIVKVIIGDKDVFKGSNNLPTFVAPPPPPPKKVK